MAAAPDLLRRGGAALTAPGCLGDGDDDRADTPPSAAGASPGTLAKVPEIYRRLEPSVVAVRVTTSQGRGEGSGVVHTPRTIVTNNHVVAGAREVEVRLATGATIDATVTGRDPRTDLAILEVDRDLPPARFAESMPPVGSLAVAMGNPLGFEGFVTAGIVSGIDRAIPSGGRTPALVNLIQTDAPISPGNSGGALVDADGRVIGINVAYLPPASRAVSIGFAIPSPVVLDVVRQLREDGAVEHAFLGVQLRPLTPEVAERLGVSVTEGAIVGSVGDGTPAGRAGLRPGDVIVRAGEWDVEAVEAVEAVAPTKRAAWGLSPR